jgi:hypothetical protein
MSGATAGPVRAGWLPGLVFAAVLGPQLALVAAAGTDAPFHDQWGVEGQWLYPAWRDGTLTAAGLFQPVNEHRIVWTQLLNLGLFAANGQWDPLVQLGAMAGLRAACAAGLAWAVARRLSLATQAAVAAAVTWAFLPHLAWHGVLWGFESQVDFALGFSLLALGLLGVEAPSRGRMAAGLVAGAAALLAMGAGAMVPVALTGLALLRIVERRAVTRAQVVAIWPAALLLAFAWWLRVEVPEHAALKPAGWPDFFAALGRVLAWPHGGGPGVAVVLNLPLLAVVLTRGLRRRSPAPAEDRVVLFGGWSVALALATAWSRGGGPELQAGVPSRYVDFVVLLPLANVWCAVVLARAVAGRRGRIGRFTAVAWGAFLLTGWLGLSAEVMRGLVLPRAADRAAPVRLLRAYQESGDAAVFAGQPRLLVPHPNPAVVRAVLDDPRLRGALPPSLQPERPLGPLSRAVRWLLGPQ